MIECIAVATQKHHYERWRCTPPRPANYCCFYDFPDKLIFVILGTLIGTSEGETESETAK